MVTVATALMVGFRPKRAREKMTMGMVEQPGPDKNDDNTTSSKDSVNVNKKADTKAYVSSTLNPSASGQLVTFTAAVSTVAPGAGTPKGTVTFKDGSKTMATKTLDSLGQATYTTSALSSGNHSITVVYSGGDDFNGSTSPVLKQSVTK